MLRRILHELRHHAPFTLAGTIIGIAVMMLMLHLQGPHAAHAPHEGATQPVRPGAADHEEPAGHEHEAGLHGLAGVLFAIFHPGHVFLSAMVTAALYRRLARGRWWATLLIGMVGSIGIATVSDSLIPYLGEVLHHLPAAHVHAGFIEEWYLVFPAAIGGVALAMVWPVTTFPHAGHVLMSTAASLFHMMMAVRDQLTPLLAAQLGVFLFLAVLLPCCTSDIVFPLLFVGKGARPPCARCHPDGKAGGDAADADGREDRREDNR